MSRNVLVTGGASGIGLALARRFAQAGDRVLLADPNDTVGGTMAAELGGSYLKCRAFALAGLHTNQGRDRVVDRGPGGRVRPKGVRINAVAPGFTLTPALQSRIDSGDRDPAGMESLSTLGRLVKPEEVAKAGFFLCSDAASGITGVNLPVDCGYMAAISYNTYPS